ncbi:hypothetical protein PIB30_025949, partial [Stylosanthes scabra]|nr:hypothetical protein [Stylosanthes scabra]
MSPIPSSVRYREIRRKDVLWLVASSSQGCIDTIEVTQVKIRKVWPYKEILFRLS